MQLFQLLFSRHKSCYFRGNFFAITQIPCASKIIDSICLGQETTNGYFFAKENIDTGTYRDSLPTR